MFGADNLMILAFLAGSSLILLLSLVMTGRKQPLDDRLGELADPNAPAASREMVNQFTRSTLPKLGTMFLPKAEEQRTKLTTRLIHAGYYSRQALAIFLGVKGLLVIVCPVIGIVLGLLGLVELTNGLLFGAIAGGFGIVGPSFYLDIKKKRRQTTMRRALPDSLDVFVICLEGGLSFAAAVGRVVQELRLAHPTLALEMRILQREVQMGLSMGEAWRMFGTRCDLEEVRSLASVVLQSERFGASLVKALKVHAESLRIKRMQRAEEMAQKAVIKVLFPTMFCIFPALFLVVLGPAVIQIMRTFGLMGMGGGGPGT